MGNIAATAAAAARAAHAIAASPSCGRPQVVRAAAAATASATCPPLQQVAIGQHGAVRGQLDAVPALAAIAPVSAGAAYHAPAPATASAPAARAADQAFGVDEGRRVRDHDCRVSRAAVAAPPAGRAAQAGHTAFTDDVRQRRDWRQQRHASDKTRCTAGLENTWSSASAIGKYGIFYVGVTGCL
ncbi:hypothetical protein M5J07_10370 [Achromobacter mucicolens]|nr:hypothetical protein [Achromobacter mucicolens]